MNEIEVLENDECYNDSVKQCSSCLETKPIEEFWSKRSACKDCAKKQDRARRLADPDIQKSRKLEYYYGITLIEYQAMLIAQDYKCAICRRSDEEMGTLAVDHDHKCCPGRKSCGKCIRSLLCDSCNRGIGFFEDNSKRLLAAAEYTRKEQIICL